MNREQNVEKVWCKRELGSFYTPINASRILCNWAIRSPDDLILEPSFGGCGFLQAAKEKLETLGSSNPISRLYGCDIDERAFNHLSKLLGPLDISKRFFLDDFLRLGPKHFSKQRFDIVIGNPPYVSHHRMSKQQKTAATEAMQVAGINISKRSSLWAYFVLHGMSFLAEGGRAAWLLPASLLYADYALPILKEIQSLFSQVVVITLSEKLFQPEGSNESTIVLLCDGWKAGPAPRGVEITHAEALDDFSNIVKGLTSTKPTGKRLGRRSGYSELTDEGRRWFDTLSSQPEAFRLGQIARVKIGIVTGDNQFFLINKQTAAAWNLPKNVLKPILSRSFMANGLYISDADLLELAKRNERCLFLDTSGLGEKSPPVQEYLDSYPEDKRSKVSTFKRREIWHRIDDKKAPHAFLTYLSQTGPKMIVNNGNFTCTNSIHRVFLADGLPQFFPEVLAISFLSTFSQLSAEIEGRRYGSGALKHEPKDAMKIAALIPDRVNRKDLSNVFASIDSALRQGENQFATEEADRFLCDILPLHQLSDGIKVMRKDLIALRTRRLAK